MSTKWTMTSTALAAPFVGIFPAGDLVGHVSACGHVPGAGSLPQRVLRLADASSLGSEHGATSSFRARSC